MVSGFPELEVSGGSGAEIDIGYTEALYDEQQRRGNRNEVANRKVKGLFDEFLPDGGSARHFIPLWPRTWRYLQLQVKTADSPLNLEGLRVYFSAYPFEQRATFSSSDPDLGKIWDICWRTARLDARETYMDTPFWEQLQYVDDTRIQSLIPIPWRTTIDWRDRRCMHSINRGCLRVLPRAAIQAFCSSSFPTSR
jgi:hypothetical protein